jgi:DNA-binding HxlR family transcriptional regulator
MLPRNYDGQNCSIARTLEVIGDRWTMLVIRDAFLGVRRFDDFQRSLGVARNVLADRLARLCADGVLQRRSYQQRPERYEYELTAQGLDLWPVLVSLLTWGDRYRAEAGPPRLILHRDCGGQITARATCSTCGVVLNPGDVTTAPGPGMSAAALVR